MPKLQAAGYAPLGGDDGEGGQSGDEIAELQRLVRKLEREVAAAPEPGVEWQRRHRLPRPGDRRGAGVEQVLPGAGAAGRQARPRRWSEPRQHLVGAGLFAVQGAARRRPHTHGLGRRLVHD
eukprot:COSAG04_NODE_582_length_12404_cov_81.591792_7_plen_122_part_00